MSDLEGMLAGAMKDPRFSEILSTLKEKADSGELDVGEMIGELTGKEEPPAKTSPGIGEHKKLLAALRPYLADPKKNAVDEILKIGEFSGIIEALSKGKR